MMEYKGYTGCITTVDEDQGLIHGRVAGLIDVISFEGRDFKEIVQAFHDSVEDYLEDCAERQAEPEKPFSGKFLVRIPAELHKEAALAAKKADQSLNAWVGSAIHAKLDQGKEPEKRRRARRPRENTFAAAHGARAGRPAHAKAKGRAG